MVGSWDPVEMTITCDQHNVSIPHSLLCGGDVIVMNNITMYYKNNSIVFSKYNIMPHQYCNIIVVVVLSWFFLSFSFFSILLLQIIQSGQILRCYGQQLITIPLMSLLPKCKVC